MPLLVLSICLTCRFRVTVTALLSLVGPAHQLLLPPAAFTCSSKIQIGCTFLVPAHLGSPGHRAIIQVCVCVFRANKFDLILPKFHQNQWSGLEDTSAAHLCIKCYHIRHQPSRSSSVHIAAPQDSVFHQLQQAQHHCWHSTWHWTHHPSTDNQVSCSSVKWQLCFQRVTRHLQKQC